jgi:hypothetical protein
MKVKILVACILFNATAIAGDYHPIPGKFDQFEDHYLYESFIEARNSSDADEAILKWNAFIAEAQIGGIPEELDDITQYELYRKGIAELFRLYYSRGRQKDGDKFLRLYENITVVEVPSGKLLRDICSKVQHTTLNKEISTASSMLHR